MRARLRTPVEVGWQRAVKFDHDFIGRAALEAEVADPRRTIATLRWNPEDVVDIYASLLQPGEEYKTIDLPTSPPWSEGMNIHADHLLKDGRPIGYSSGHDLQLLLPRGPLPRGIDVDQAEIGNEVVVQWGDHGGRIKDVRATVERFPYLTDPRNSDVDTTALGGQPRPSVGSPSAARPISPYHMSRSWRLRCAVATAMSRKIRAVRSPSRATDAPTVWNRSSSITFQHIKHHLAGDPGDQHVVAVGVVDPVLGPLRRHSSMCRSAPSCSAASAVAMWVSARPYHRWYSRSSIRGPNGGSPVVFVRISRSYSSSML